MRQDSPPGEQPHGDITTALVTIPTKYRPLIAYLLISFPDLETRKAREAFGIGLILRMLCRIRKFHKARGNETMFWLFRKQC